MPELHDQESIDFSGTDITDDDLRYLQGFTRIRYLNLNGTRVTDAGVEHILALSSLTSLNINATWITASGTKLLTAHPHLTGITLSDRELRSDWVDSHREFDDEALIMLTRMPNLKSIGLFVHDMSRDGETPTARIKAERPDIQVFIGYYGMHSPWDACQ